MSNTISSLRGSSVLTRVTLRPASRSFRLASFLAVLGGLFSGPTVRSDGPVAEKFNAGQIEFFESKVRPLLVENCFSCHGEKKQYGGLRLDSRAAVLKGSDNGAVVQPGKPDESRLIKVLSHMVDPKMPPSKKLPEQEQMLLSEWVTQKLPWPDETVKVQANDLAWNGKLARSHWAFQSPKAGTLPTVRQANLVKTPVDSFILAKLETVGLSFSPLLNQGPERRLKLLRRVTFDLTGLPPTVEEMDAFLKDDSKDAYATVVERLLSSPSHGEHWARHWLDVARYATNQQRATVYRDWVVRAFNSDMPYDEFLRLQVAGDLLPALPPDAPADERFRRLGGMALLRIGKGGDKHEVIDDSIDVLMRGTQGLTVTCARCHDHKFEPIPTADYYSLYSIFENTASGEVALQRSLPEHSFGESVRRKAAEDYLKPRYQALKDSAFKDFAELLKRVPALKDGKDADEVVKGTDFNPNLVLRWHMIANQNANNFHPLWTGWRDLESIAKDEFTEKAPSVLAANEKLNPVLLAKLKEKPALKSFDDVAERFASLISEANRKWQEGKAADPKFKGLPDKAWAELKSAVDGFAGFNHGDAEKMLVEPDLSIMKALRDEQARFAAASGSLTGIILKDEAKVQPTGKIFVRGNAKALGAEVPRQFLAVVAGEKRASFGPNGSGRLQLAEALTARDNPLTARVMVNRVWAWHFGQGLVKTPSDFGLRGESPSNPELLDYLAVQFMDNGWSLKKLHRLIVLSSTYQQASDRREDGDRIDPDNRLLWRMERRRLGFESMRDALVAVSAGIDPAPTTQTVDVVGDIRSRKRTLYARIDRVMLPELFRFFDLPNPALHSEQRFQTTVPQQALYFVNGPFVPECARRLIQQPDVVKLTDTAERIRRIYRTALGRLPSPTELKLVQDFIAHEEKLASESSRFGHGQFSADEGRLKSFVPFTEWTDTAWQPTAIATEAERPWMSLEAGKAGTALVRRWTSPREGKISIEGMAEHVDWQGKGVRCHVISSQSGKVANWNCRNGRVKTVVAEVDVKAGDTLDFVVQSQSGQAEGYDSFSWVATLRALGPIPEKGVAEWRIGGAEAWQKFAQALLMSNEFLFID